MTCLVTLFDRKLQIFKNSPNWTIFGIFNLFLSIRSQCWMRLILWFSNTVIRLATTKVFVLCIFKAENCAILVGFKFFHLFVLSLEVMVETLPRLLPRRLRAKVQFYGAISNFLDIKVTKVLALELQNSLVWNQKSSIKKPQQFYNSSQAYLRKK